MDPEQVQALMDANIPLKWGMRIETSDADVLMVNILANIPLNWGMRIETHEKE